MHCRREIGDTLRETGAKLWKVEVRRDFWDVKILGEFYTRWMEDVYGHERRDLGIKAAANKGMAG